MARPPKPLISRDRAVAAAIGIIDDQGLEAFSMPRLAGVLGVTTPALYHHFADRSEILAEVARAIILQTRIPRRPASGQWQDWIVAYGLNFRKAVLRHRKAAAVLLQFLPADIVTDMWEETAIYLEESGVPAQLHVPILNGMEKLTLGAIVAEAMRPESQQAAVFANVNAAEHPVLSAARESNQSTPRQLYEQMMRNFLFGVTHEDRVD